MMHENPGIDEKIDALPGAVHLKRIRSALSSGHAAVMVGAGFSLNAVHGHRLHTWGQLIQELAGDLASNPGDAARRYAGTSGMLRLAEEYAASLGRTQLDSRIKQLLPDTGVTSPGKLHYRLLALNWVDIFTTNYDTLLERACELDRKNLNPVIERRYEVVMSPSDLPFSKSNGRPRIVKLHGSFPSTRPLVISEEDYRCYPRDFAPFVNAVQQSMLENVFCLIGFSGEDPNFLQWSGWVRDRLGAQTPPIYLITMDDVPNGQRLVLEQRNIFPVSISSLAGEKKDYESAYGSLLTFFEREPRQEPDEWPFEKISPESYKEDDKAAFLRRIERWKGNRLSHPGWLVTPKKNRESLNRLSQVTSANLAYNKYAEEITLYQRLQYHHELNWITEILLQPMKIARAKDILGLLIEAKPHLSVEKEESVDLKSMGDIQSHVEEAREIYTSLSLALRRFCRENALSGKGDIDLSQLNICSQENSAAFLYERIIENLEGNRIADAVTNIESWKNHDSSDDPYWPIRYAALHAEVGLIERARSIGIAGLAAIRERIQFEGETPYLVSREQWAEVLLDVIEHAGNNSYSLTGERDASQESKEQIVPRDPSASRHVHHPWNQVSLLTDILDIAASVGKSRDLGFESSLTHGSAQIVQELPDSSATAFAMARLVDVAAFVPRMQDLVLTANDMLSCARILMRQGDDVNYLRLVIRAQQPSAFEALDTLPRCQLRYLNKDDALRLRNQCQANIKELLSSDRSGLEHHNESVLKFNLELGSRLLFRLDTDIAVDSLREAISWKNSKSLRRYFGCHRIYGIYLRRAILCIPDGQALVDLGPGLYDACIDENDTFRSAQSWPNIKDVIDDGRDMGSDRNGWHEVVNAEIEVFSSKPERRAGSLGRLVWLQSRGFLDSNQEYNLSKLLWGSRQNALPETPGHYAFSSLLWNSFDLSHAKNQFRNEIVNSTLANIVSTSFENGKSKKSIRYPVDNNFLCNVLGSSNRDINFEWAGSEALTIVSIMQAWWNDEGKELLKQSERALLEDRLNLILNRLSLIGWVFQQVLAEKLAGWTPALPKISAFMEEMWLASYERGLPVASFLLAGLEWWPAKANEVVRILSQLLSMEKDSVLINTLNAICRYLTQHPDETAATRAMVELLMRGIRSRSRWQLPGVIKTLTTLILKGRISHLNAHLEELESHATQLMLDLYSREKGVRWWFCEDEQPYYIDVIAELLLELKIRKNGSPPMSRISELTAVMQDDPLLAVRIRAEQLSKQLASNEALFD